MPISPDQAQRFASAWFAAWNAHDVPRIMALYAPEIEHSSPFIARYHTGPGAPPTAIKGLDNVGAYFQRAIDRNTDPPLKFIPMHVTVGLESVILVYRRMSVGGDLAAEVFFFNPAGLVIRSVSHYEPLTPSPESGLKPARIPPFQPVP